jgi:hypothetical protein
MFHQTHGMYDEYKVPRDELVRLKYPVDKNNKIDRISTAFFPKSGLFFINPKNPKQIIFQFKLGKIAKYFLNHDMNFTVDVDLVSHGRGPKISRIMHSMPETLATADTDFGDDKNRPVSTLFLTYPRHIDPDESNYVIFEFEKDVTGLKHHVNWQLGYDTDIFTSAGLAEHLSVVKQRENNQMVYLYKRAKIEGYIALEKHDCWRKGIDDACESFALATDFTANVDKDSYVNWSNQKWSENHSASSARKTQLGRIADFGKRKATTIVEY